MAIHSKDSMCRRLQRISKTILQLQVFYPLPGDNSHTLQISPMVRALSEKNS